MLETKSSKEPTSFTTMYTALILKQATEPALILPNFYQYRLELNWIMTFMNKSPIPDQCSQKLSLPPFNLCEITFITRFFNLDMNVISDRFKMAEFCLPEEIASRHGINNFIGR